MSEMPEDDVEGHGLREIAAGVGTVAVLAGSAAGVAHAAGMTSAASSHPVHTVAHSVIGTTKPVANPVQPPLGVVGNQVHKVVKDLQGEGPITKDGTGPVAPIVPASSITPVTNHPLAGVHTQVDGAKQRVHHVAQVIKDSVQPVHPTDPRGTSTDAVDPHPVTPLTTTVKHAVQGLHHL